VSRDRGLRLQNALAAYLRQWWPSAESAGSGRPGSDVLGTPGIVWENKTSAQVRAVTWIDQVKSHRRRSIDLPVVVYWPPLLGDQRAELAVAMLPLGELIQLLHEAGWTAERSVT
jgi:hypothetical protein